MASKPTYEHLENTIADLQKEVEKLKGAKENLCVNEEQFRPILENSIDAIWQTDLRNKVIYISPSSINIGGYTPEEVMAFENALELYDEETRTLITDEMSKYLQKPIEELKRCTIPPIEGKGLHKDGHKIWIEVQAKFVFEGDSLKGLQGVTRNISERKEFELALQESEKLLKTVIESTEDGILAVDRNENVITTNSRFHMMWRIPSNMFKEKDIRVFRSLVLPQLKKPERFLSKTQEIYSKSTDAFDIIEFKDGRKYERYSHPMTRVGEYIGRVWSYRDISRKARAEATLRESEERYRTLVENLPVAVYQNTPGPDGRFLMVNPAFCRIFGYSSAEEVMEVKVSDVYANPGERKKFSDELLNKGIIEIEERELVKKDGTPIYASVTASARHGKDGDTPHFDCILTDITEQKKLQDQLLQAQKMESLGRLAGGVAHDLNNILSGLVGYPELLLLQLPENSSLKKPLLTIKKSGEKAAALVQDLLTLARRGVVVKEVVDLNHIISEFLETPEHEKFQADHPRVTVKTLLNNDILNISGSPVHLSKTVMNLINNAAEATPEDGEILIATENRHLDRPLKGYGDVKEGDYVVLSIADTGTGISPEDMGSIFEPFYTKKKMGRSGTGLGTTVVWGTVKDHRGYIDVQSAEGKGTTFTLYFPATREKLAEKGTTVNIESYRGNGEFILVVDDVESQRQIASAILTELGYHVSSVSSGEAAVEYLQSQTADLLVLDMIMDPGMDGLETYKKILEYNPEQKAIIVSGFSETDRVKEFQSLRSGGYLKKPFLLEKIGFAVKQELAK
jgi:two-component system cell cycle sensor histidine kinase/response regulator CckA